ncbi:hypothetical protein SUGI_1066920 [Cryptomeria japonica]|nr:hypothetical protein SUGI_1066920 [Cryptomeria japonica]
MCGLYLDNTISFQLCYFVKFEHFLIDASAQPSNTERLLQRGSEPLHQMLTIDIENLPHETLHKVGWRTGQ